MNNKALAPHRTALTKAFGIVPYLTREEATLLIEEAKKGKRGERLSGLKRNGLENQIPEAQKLGEVTGI